MVTLSRISGRRPARASSNAALAPVGPPPMMRASYISGGGFFTVLYITLQMAGDRSDCHPEVLRRTSRPSLSDVVTPIPLCCEWWARPPSHLTALFTTQRRYEFHSRRARDERSFGVTQDDSHLTIRPSPRLQSPAVNPPGTNPPGRTPAGHRRMRRGITLSPPPDRSTERSTRA